MRPPETRLGIPPRPMDAHKPPGAPRAGSGEKQRPREVRACPDLKPGLPDVLVVVPLTQARSPHALPPHPGAPPWGQVRLGWAV